MSVALGLVILAFLIVLCIGAAVHITYEFVKNLRLGLSGAPWQYPSLRDSLFRVVIVSFFLLFVAVLGGSWLLKRQDEAFRAKYGDPKQQAIAALRLAYQEQPSIEPNTDPSSPEIIVYEGRDRDPVNERKGLWIDAATYRRISSLISDSGNSANLNQQGSLSLDAGDNQGESTYSPSHVRELVPSQRLRDLGSNSWSMGWGNFPQDLMGLPLEASEKRLATKEQKWLDEVRARGTKVGSGGFSGDHFRYAFWRTGANSAYYVTSFPNGKASSYVEPWYTSLAGYEVQAVVIYAFLTPFAALVAWLMARRIARPVAEVAKASTAMAAGERPGAIAVRGPQELAELTRAFNRMTERLAAAEAAQRDFVASVSHELKTPLTAIDGYAELLADGAVDGPQAGAVIGTEAARLRRLVGDLLDLARIDRAEFTVLDERVDLASLARSLEDRFRGVADELGVKLLVEVEPGAAAGADAGRLLQVGSNLSENALRVTPPGESVLVRAGAGELQVVDAGPGLSDDDIAHAFERFYLHNKYSGPEVGTGLGLAIVKQLVEAMGGTVEVSSTTGAGTTFTVRLRPAPAGDGASQG